MNIISFHSMFHCISFHTLCRLSGFSGMEWWTGMVEWNGGMEWWNGTVEWNGGMEWWNGMVEWNGGLEWWNGMVE